MAERIRFQPPWSPTLEQLADGVWVVRGDLKRGMNVYLLEEEGGVVAFDAGTQPMVGAVSAAAQRLGGLRRVVLGHADSDHRGTAPHLGVPVHCHPADADAAGKPGPFRDYWDISQLEVAPVEWLYRHYLHRRWDGGAVELEGTIDEGDLLCGFEVLHFPGHAPGLIGLWRESDRLAIVSDTVYFVDSARLKPLPELDREGATGHVAGVPHRAWNWDDAKARESLLKLASLRPRTVLAGHEGPLRGDPGAVESVLTEAAQG